MLLYSSQTKPLLIKVLLCITSNANLLLAIMLNPFCGVLLKTLNEWMQSCKQLLKTIYILGLPLMIVPKPQLTIETISIYANTKYNEWLNWCFIKKLFYMWPKGKLYLFWSTLLVISNWRVILSRIRYLYNHTTSEPKTHLAD